MRSLNIGATGMLAQQTNVEVISNNIANMNTTGYTQRKAIFHDLLYQNMRRAGFSSSDSDTIVPAGIQIGLGVKTAAVYRIPSQGNLLYTGKPLNLALQGRGYFQIELPDGTTAYTRDGSFQPNADGEIVTHDGYRVVGPGVIPAEAEDVTVNESGEIQYKLTGENNWVQAGQMLTVLFVNDAGMDAIGDNLFLESEASGAPVEGVPGQDGRGKVLQDYLETSNVNVVSEITDLISAQRAYEMNSKVVTTSDEMLSTVSRLKT